MTRRPQATVRILTMPHLHPEAVRIEIDCRYSTTGLTSIPAAGMAITRAQLITSATFEHEARCHGECDTEDAHRQGDPEIRAATDQAWSDLQVAMTRRYAASRRN